MNERAASGDFAMKAAAACAIAALGLFDAVWAHHAGLSFGHWIQSAALVAFLVALGFFYGSIRRSQPLSDMALYGALWVVFTFSAAILTYLMATLKFPLCDAELAAIDATLGFSWSAWSGFVKAHPLLKLLFVVAYAILLAECLASIIYFAHANRGDRNAELLWSALLSILITATISGIYPAAGAFVFFGVPEHAQATYLPHLLALRDGSRSTFLVNDMQGIISMPSYHTVLAILVAYAYRGCGWLFALALVLNGVMLFSIPSEGGHYLIDVVAGGAIAAVTITMVSAATRTRWWRTLAEADATAHQPDHGERAGVSF